MGKQESWAFPLGKWARGQGVYEEEEGVEGELGAGILPDAFLCTWRMPLWGAGKPSLCQAPAWNPSQGVRGMASRHLHKQHTWRGRLLRSCCARRGKCGAALEALMEGGALNDPFLGVW